MTDNEKFAELLEWEKIDRLHYRDKDGNYVLDGTPFEPEKDIKQAFGVVDAMGCDYELWKHGGQYRLALMSEEPSLGPQAPTPQEAICEAVEQALKGGSDENI